LRHLNPFPRNLGDIITRFEKVVVPEMNMGQLSMLLRAKYLLDIVSFPKVKGKPFKISELVKRFEELLG